ncbi:class I lanthipeptide [uncultured Kordia sp.]|uniref:class I lanthipeptide n=1 Tax=uncultured Kordia sp. TaxID=507699 RepID=UPI00262FBEAE|nr:class I lanthipeptide [uncultured Kordia sp.]
MKKKSIKNLNLNKKSISKLNSDEIKGGTIVPTGVCWSIISCPSLTCTEGVVCDIIRTEDPLDIR